MRVIASLSVALAFILPLTAAGASISLAAPAGKVDGVWQTQSGDTRVRIGPCDGSWCGVIVWTRDGGADVKNPAPALRSRSLNGIAMITGMKPDSAGAYAGQLYNYRDGKTYTGKMQPLSPTQLQLKGCILGGLICSSQTWTRVQ